MNIKKVFKAASIALILGSLAPLAQANVFTYNPSLSGIGGGNVAVTGDEMVGRFSTGLTSGDGFATLSASGWINVNGIFQNSIQNFTDGGLDIGNGLGAYDLWATFNYTATANGGPGDYKLNTFNFSLYAGSGTAARVFTNAAVNVGVLTPATVSSAGTEILLGTGSLISGEIDTNNSQTSTSLLVDTTFLINPAYPVGTFFTAPDPFFDLAFNSASSVVPLLDPSNGVGAVNGTTEVRFANVPEPTSLTLIGLGLFAMGGLASRRRRLA